MFTAVINNSGQTLYGWRQRHLKDSVALVGGLGRFVGFDPQIPEYPPERFEVKTGETLHLPKHHFTVAVFYELYEAVEYGEHHFKNNNEKHMVSPMWVYESAAAFAVVSFDKPRLSIEPKITKDDFLLAKGLTTGWNTDETDMSSGHEATYGWRRLTAEYAQKLLSHMEIIHASLPNDPNDERKNLLDIGYVRRACDLTKTGVKNNIFFYKKVKNFVVAIALGNVGVVGEDKALPLYVDVVLSSKGHGRPFMEHILRGHWEGFRVAYKGCEQFNITLDSIDNVVDFYKRCDMVQDGVADDLKLIRMSKTVGF